MLATKRACFHKLLGKTIAIHTWERQFRNLAFLKKCYYANRYIQYPNSHFTHINETRSSILLA